MYESILAEQVSQGDIFDDLLFSYIDDEGNVVSHVGRVALLTFGCEYDKPKCEYVTVAEVIPLDVVPLGDRGNVRNYRVANAFYLEPRDWLEESYISLLRTARLSKKFVAVNAHRRIGSMTRDARLALQDHLTLFFGYDREPPEE